MMGRVIRTDKRPAQKPAKAPKNRGKNATAGMSRCAAGI
jgi:hypothetical protein